MKRVLMVMGSFAALVSMGQAAAADGKAVYDKTCAMCHKVMAPKLGDKKAWEPKIAMGNDALVASVIKGKGAMKPRGGAASLSDDDIKAAVEYIVSQAK